MARRTFALPSHSALLWIAPALAIFLTLAAVTGCKPSGVRDLASLNESNQDKKDQDKNNTPSAGLPAGAVVPFSLSTCPTGWEEFATAKGRILVGSGSGNSDADGVALTPRTAGATGGREYTTGIPASNTAANTPVSIPANTLAASQPYYTTNAADITIGGPKADSNLPPFVARLFCKKLAQDSQVPLGALIHLESNSCPTGFTADPVAKGRMILGSGSGNTDADGTALTPRALGATGGLEVTTGIPASTSAGATSSTPGPSRNLGTGPMGVGLYYYDVPNTSVSGARADSNLPPYLVATACERTGSDSPPVPTGTWVAFDLSSCPSGWSSSSGLRGRSLLSAGSGNLDSAGNALTNRTSGNTGGREYTTGVPAHSIDPGDHNTPADPNDSLARSSPGFVYTSNPPDTTLSGDKADSNMPPFVVVLYCRKD